MPTIKLGATRLVVLTRRYAFKFPRPTHWHLFLLGLLANRQERIFSRLGWDELCPVLFSLPGGWLVVMPRCQSLVKGLTVGEYDEFVCRKEGGHVPVEDKDSSFGLYHDEHGKEKLVAIDYGS